MFDFDPEKDAKNQAQGRISLRAAADGDWAEALLTEDTRRNYGERRYVGYLMIYGRLHVIVFTPREDRIRVISLRRANVRETKRYERLKNRA